jgi:maltose alpha-D-glucosyltransferase/alpha-amylase
MSFPQIDALFLSELRGAFAAQLPDYLLAQRWFRAKARQIRSVTLAECVEMPLAGVRALVTFARVEFSEGPGETYVLPLLQSGRGNGTEAAEEQRSIVRLRDPDNTGEILLSDALANEEFLARILTAIQDNRQFAGEHGELLARCTREFRPLLPDAETPPRGRILKAEQSNTSILYGDRLILKFYRSVEEGINPDLEIGRFLTEVAHFRHTPSVAGWLEYRSEESRSTTLGILQAFVANQGDAWTCTLRLLREWLAHAEAHRKNGRALPAKAEHGRGSVPPPDSAPNAPQLPPALAEELEAQVAFMGLLGARTAEMHLALASAISDPAFAPEPFDATFREALGTSLHDLTVRNFDLLRASASTLPESLGDTAHGAAKLEEDVLLAFHTILEKKITAKRTRIHGDYHLGQVLFTGSDFVIIDFEGEPARPIQERRGKRSPLQDVAGMLRSFHYAERAALLAETGSVHPSSERDSAIPELLSLWRRAASSRFLELYRATAQGAPFLPKDLDEFNALLRLHALEKAVYELGYELNNRPSWLAIPLNGIDEWIGRH